LEEKIFGFHFDPVEAFYSFLVWIRSGSFTIKGRMCSVLTNWVWP
jgi:hypothetical protein